MNRLLVPFALSLVLTRPALAQLPADLSPFLDGDRAAEVAMARSAAPKWVSDSATVLYLTRAGYVEAAKGTNGWTCLVVRNYEAGLDDFAPWALVTLRAPHCLNPAAVRSILPEMEARATLVMSGLKAEEVAKHLKEEFRTGQLPQPEPGAMAYMLSRQQTLSTGPHPEWKPHVMFYQPASADASHFGVGSGANAPVLETPPDPTTGFIVLIPVMVWSDGTPFVATPTDAHQQ